jgi:hypothetical protein
MNHISIQTLLQPQPPQQLEESLTTATNTEIKNENIRTVILQRINEDLCWMIASDQLLQKYTSSSSYDLQWLKQFALYTVLT